jgi:sulfite exporter TauE/SafE
VDPAFLAAMAGLGAASGLHCIGMCGGIVTAFSLRTRTGDGARALTPVILFNAGRIASYAGAGAVAGTVGSLGWYASGGQTALFILANVVLIFVGLYIAGLRSPMRWFERLGAPLWRRVQPHAARLMQKKSAFPAGLLWGFLPCGLVYGALTAAAFAGSAQGGAAAMTAYGIGTLPWLLAAGVAAARLRAWMAGKAVRLAVGGTVLGFGAWGLAHAGTTFICS